MISAVESSGNAVDDIYNVKGRTVKYGVLCYAFAIVFWDP